MRGRLLAAAGARDRVRQFNARYPVGTQVRYWPNGKEGQGCLGVTRSAAYVADHQVAAVLVQDYRFWIPLSRVEPVVEVVPGGWFPNYDGHRDGVTEQ